MGQALPLDRLALDALKSLGKTLGQMTLYKIGHPEVAATLKAAEEHLLEALSQTQGELAFSIDQDKIIANGRIIGSMGELPSSLASMFTRFKLASVTFKAGITNVDLVALCELAASRPGSGPASPVAYFKEKNITRIIFNEAVYTKRVGEDDALERGLKQKSLEKTIRGLVERAVVETNRQKEVLGKVLELLQQDIQKRIDEATKNLRQERTVLQNEQARTQNVLANMVEGIVMVDELGKILMMNPAAEELYGTTLA